MVLKSVVRKRAGRVWKNGEKQYVLHSIAIWSGLPWWLRWSRICLQFKRPRFDPWFGKIPWRKKWQPTLVFLPREFHGQRSLVGYSPWGGKEMDTTEQVTISFQLLIKAHHKQLEKQRRKKNNVPCDTFNWKISVRTQHEVSLQQSHYYVKTTVRMLRKIWVIQQSDNITYL